MMGNSDRRCFLQTALVFSSLLGVPINLFSRPLFSAGRIDSMAGNLKLSLNAYSFNAPLSKGEMSLDDLLEFCSLHKFHGVDITAYYFPGYPEVPSDEYLYRIKRKAFSLGLDISGTGIRNDFTDPDKSRREADIKMTKAWIQAAAKMGAPVIRIFSGTQEPEGYSWDQVASWMIEDIRECVDYGKKHGIVVAIQNHNDFIKTADQVIYFMEAVNSEWFGLILDTGSYGQGDPYKEIEKSIPYAVSWQIKEKINRNGVEEPIDLKRLVKLIKTAEYSGYLPIETLGPGDPKVKVPSFLHQVREALKD